MAEATSKTSNAAASKDSATVGSVARELVGNNASPAKTSPGIRLNRLFSKPGVSPYDEVQWEYRTASITDAGGKSIFEQKDVEVPVDWSMTATNIVASKYLHGQIDTDERETGVRQLVSRVAETVRDWGIKGDYFATPKTHRSSTTSWRICW